MSSNLFTHYLQVAITMLEAYQPPQPFNLFAKAYFSQFKKYGSRDRKMISELCYRFMRVSYLFSGKLNEENLLLAYWLLAAEQDKLIGSLLPKLAAKTAETFEGKAQIILPDVLPQHPMLPFLGKLTDAKAFLQNLTQPQKVFVRIRPGKMKMALEKADNSGYAYQLYDDAILAFPPTTKLNENMPIGSAAIIQDLSSSRTGPVISKAVQEIFGSKPVNVWDVCAASGGKSILMVDSMKIASLTVSDIRQSILQNLNERLKMASIHAFNSLVMEVAKSTAALNKKHFDLVLCDVPCSGSGTWARTPEQLFAFSSSIIQDYAMLQKSIASNAIIHTHQNGLFVYITCSVFAAENEEQVAWLSEKFSMDILLQQYLEGAAFQADTMFIAIMKKAE